MLLGQSKRALQGAKVSDRAARRHAQFAQNCENRAPNLVQVNSMTADIMDYDESLNGRRCEGLISAANSWITKMSVSSSFILAGLVLNLTAFDASL